MVRGFRSFFVLLVALLLVFFSGCSGGGGFLGGGSGKVDQKGEDLTGKGLEVTFSVSKSSTLKNKFDAVLSLKNSGKEVVKVGQGDFRLYTEELLSNGGGAITQDSIDSFISSVFKNGDLEIYQNQQIGPIRGALFLEEEFLNDLTNKDFKLILEVKYPYKTEFKNNLEIDVTGEKLLRVLDKVSQAAPVQVSGIYLEQLTLDDFALQLKLVDAGTSSATRDVTVLNSEVLFRGNPVSGCTYSTKDSKGVVRSLNNIVLSKQSPFVMVSCPITFGAEEKLSKFTTQVSGYFVYDYKQKLERTMSIR